MTKNVECIGTVKSRFLMGREKFCVEGVRFSDLTSLDGKSSEIRLTGQL